MSVYTVYNALTYTLYVHLLARDIKCFAVIECISIMLQWKRSPCMQCIVCKLQRVSTSRVVVLVNGVKNTNNALSKLNLIVRTSTGIY